MSLIEANFVGAYALSVAAWVKFTIPLRINRGDKKVRGRVPLYLIV